MGFFGLFFHIPHPLSLIVGTISAKNNKSNRLMGCSREEAGVHIQQNAAANANCPSETEPVDLLIPELGELLTVRAVSTHPRRAVLPD